jgi:hypothetical protein
MDFGQVNIEGRNFTRREPSFENLGDERSIFINGKGPCNGWMTLKPRLIFHKIPVLD